MCSFLIKAPAKCFQMTYSFVSNAMTFIHAAICPNVSVSGQ